MTAVARTAVRCDCSLHGTVALRFCLPAAALRWDLIHTSINPAAVLVDLYFGALRRGLGVVGSHADALMNPGCLQS